MSIGTTRRKFLAMLGLAPAVAPAAASALAEPIVGVDVGGASKTVLAVVDPPAPVVFHELPVARIGGGVITPDMFAREVLELMRAEEKRRS